MQVTFSLVNPSADLIYLVCMQLAWCSTHACMHSCLSYIQYTHTYHMQMLSSNFLSTPWTSANLHTRTHIHTYLIKIVVHHCKLTYTDTYIHTFTYRPYQDCRSRRGQCELTYTDTYIHSHTHYQNLPFTPWTVWTYIRDTYIHTHYIKRVVHAVDSMNLHTHTHLIKLVVHAVDQCSMLLFQCINGLILLTLLTILRTRGKSTFMPCTWLCTCVRAQEHASRYPLTHLQIFMYALQCIYICLYI